MFLCFKMDKMNNIIIFVILFSKRKAHFMRGIQRQSGFLAVLVNANFEKPLNLFVK